MSMRDVFRKLAGLKDVEAFYNYREIYNRGDMPPIPPLDEETVKDKPIKPMDPMDPGFTQDVPSIKFEDVTDAGFFVWPDRNEPLPPDFNLEELPKDGQVHVVQVDFNHLWGWVLDGQVLAYVRRNDEGEFSCSCSAFNRTCMCDHVAELDYMRGFEYSSEEVEEHIGEDLAYIESEIAKKMAPVGSMVYAGTDSVARYIVDVDKTGFQKLYDFLTDEDTLLLGTTVPVIDEIDGNVHMAGILKGVAYDFTILAENENFHLKKLFLESPREHITALRRYVASIPGEQSYLNTTELVVLGELKPISQESDVYKWLNFKYVEDPSRRTQDLEPSEEIAIQPDPLMALTRSGRVLGDAPTWSYADRFSDCFITLADVWDVPQDDIDVYFETSKTLAKLKDGADPYIIKDWDGHTLPLYAIVVDLIPTVFYRGNEVKLEDPLPFYVARSFGDLVRDGLQNMVDQEMKYPTKRAHVRHDFYLQLLADHLVMVMPPFALIK